MANSLHPAAISRSAIGTKSLASVPEQDKPKALRLELSRAFVALQMEQRVSDTKLAASVGIARPHINMWRSGTKLPNLSHLAVMDDEAFVFVCKWLLRVRAEQGHSVYRLRPANDERGTDDGFLAALEEVFATALAMVRRKRSGER